MAISEPSSRAIGRSLYASLAESDDFAMAVGRLALSSGKLESAIRAFLESRGQRAPREQATLGQMLLRKKRVDWLVEAGIIDRTTAEHLGFMVKPRNYFMHRLHAELSDLPDNQVELKRFINRVKSLSSEMEFFGKLLTESRT